METVAEPGHASSTAPVPPAISVQPSTRDDAARIEAALTVAFAGDPPVRWVYPDAESYLRHFPEFVRAFGGGAIALGTAWQVESFAGVALWLPPQTGPDEAALVELIERSVPHTRHAEVFTVLEAQGNAHPTEPHWYLPLIGVDAAFQGRGVGSSLLQHTLGVCDREGLPAYLEATSPRSVRLYERHGFQRLEPLRVGTCPPITPMWREPA